MAYGGFTIISFSEPPIYFVPFEKSTYSREDSSATPYLDFEIVIARSIE
jgi:hypothetical protein